MNSTDTSHNADTKAIKPAVSERFRFRTVILLVALVVGIEGTAYYKPSNPL